MILRPEPVPHSHRSLPGSAAAVRRLPCRAGCAGRCRTRKALARKVSGMSRWLRARPSARSMRWCAGRRVAAAAGARRSRGDGEASRTARRRAAHAARPVFCCLRSGGAGAPREAAAWHRAEAAGEGVNIVVDRLLSDDALVASESTGCRARPRHPRPAKPTARRALHLCGHQAIPRTVRARHARPLAGYRGARRCRAGRMSGTSESL